MSETVAVRASEQPPSAFAAAWHMLRDVVVSDRKATIGASLRVSVVIVAIIGPYIAPHDVELPNTDIRLTGPTLSNIMGTDHIGRDLFSRIISGLTISLMVATGAVVIAVVIGVPIGAFAGYQGGWVDSVIMRIMDAIIAMPGRLLAIALVAAIGPSVGALWFAISFGSVPRYARLIRGGVLNLPDMAQALNNVLIALHMAVHHRRRRHPALPMRLQMHFRPVRYRRLRPQPAHRRLHAIGKDFAAAARHRPLAGLSQQ